MSMCVCVFRYTNTRFVFSVWRLRHKRSRGRDCLPQCLITIVNCSLLVLTARLLPGIAVASAALALPFGCSRKRLCSGSSRGRGLEKRLEIFVETDRLRGAKLLRRRIRKSKWRNSRRTGKWRRGTTLILASILARSRQERELGRGSFWETTGTGTRQYHLQPKLCWTELCCLVLGVSGGKGSGNRISDDVADQLSRLLVAVRLGTPWRKRSETKKAACLTESCQKFWCRVGHLLAKRRSHAISYSRHRLCLILSRSICLLIWSNLAWSAARATLSNWIDEWACKVQIFFPALARPAMFRARCCRSR